MIYVNFPLTHDERIYAYPGDLSRFTAHIKNDRGVSRGDPKDGFYRSDS